MSIARVHYNPGLGRLNRRHFIIGPFLSRAAAEKFMNDSLDFFKMRRCVDDLHPEPKFPGCIYSEMKMCLAPCFKGCSDEEYSRRWDACRTTSTPAVSHWSASFRRQRETASANLEFKTPLLCHTRIEKLKPVLGCCPRCSSPRSDACRHDPTLGGGGSVGFYRIEAGCISGPTAFPIKSLNTQNLNLWNGGCRQAWIPFAREGENRH